MSIYLRFTLIITSLITFAFVLHKMRKSKMQVFDTIIWILFSIILVLLGVFPQIVFYVKTVIGIESSVNCVFLFIIFFQIIEVFSLSVKISNMEYKMKNTIEYFSIMNSILKNGSRKNVGEMGITEEQLSQMSSSNDKKYEK